MTNQMLGPGGTAEWHWGKLKPLSDKAAEHLNAAAEPQDPTTVVVEGEAPVDTAMVFAPARQELWLVCRKCTRWGRWTAETEQAALDMADRAGWKSSEIGPTCPKCSN